MDFHAERDFGVATYCDALKKYHFIEQDKCVRNFNEFRDFITNDEVNLSIPSESMFITLKITETSIFEIRL